MWFCESAACTCSVCMCVCPSVTVCLTCALRQAVQRCVVPVMKHTLQPVRRQESNWDPGGSSWNVVRCWRHTTTVTLSRNNKYVRIRIIPVVCFFQPIYFKLCKLDIHSLHCMKINWKTLLANPYKCRVCYLIKIMLLWQKWLNSTQARVELKVALFSLCLVQSSHVRPKCFCGFVNYNYIVNWTVRVQISRHYSYETLFSVSPSSLLWWQQHLLLLHVTLPRLLRQPGSTLWVWHHFLCWGVPVCRRLRHEWGNMCSIHTVWLHLPQQILPCECAPLSNSCIGNRKICFFLILSLSPLS